MNSRWCWISDGSFEITTTPLWERACSRRRQVSRHDCLLKDRLREQARSHRGCVSATGQA
ncbi:hypothetical protein C3E98_020845 [Pseudomonas sp. MWU13-2625]|nr:hypothetical protein C3E98_020845 [Pseudomonas sp. MWU13-2625]